MCIRDRGKIDSSGQPRLPADALSCIGGVAFSDCDERDGTDRAQRLQRGGTGRENHQIEISPPTMMRVMMNLAVKVKLITVPNMTITEMVKLFEFPNIRI